MLRLRWELLAKFCTPRPRSFNKSHCPVVFCGLLSFLCSLVCLSLLSLLSHVPCTQHSARNAKDLS